MAITNGCDCGADDCTRCFPGRFRNGRFLYTSCSSCGLEYREDKLDINGMCEDCIRVEAEEDSAESFLKELKLEGMTIELARKVVSAVADEKIENMFFEI